MYLNGKCFRNLIFSNFFSIQKYYQKINVSLNLTGKVFEGQFCISLFRFLIRFLKNQMK